MAATDEQLRAVQEQRGPRSSGGPTNVQVNVPKPLRLSLSSEYVANREAALACEQARAQQRRIAHGEEFWRMAFVPKRHAKVPANHNKRWAVKLATLLPRLGTGCLLGLYGPRGTGKTQMAVELIRQVCQGADPGDLPVCYGPRYTTAMEFFLRLRATYHTTAGGEANELGVLKSFAQPTLLVIDDAHERGDTEWEDRMLTCLIDMRYREMRDTILVSNQTRDALLAALGLSITSRLTETGGLICCDWPSLRVPLTTPPSPG